MPATKKMTAAPPKDQKRRRSGASSCLAGISRATDHPLTGDRLSAAYENSLLRLFPSNQPSLCPGASLLSKGPADSPTDSGPPLVATITFRLSRMLPMVWSGNFWRARTRRIQSDPILRKARISVRRPVAPAPGNLPLDRLLGHDEN